MSTNKEEIEEVTLLARVLFKAILGLHYKRKEQKTSGQLATFLAAEAAEIMWQRKSRKSEQKPFLRCLALADAMRNVFRKL